MLPGAQGQEGRWCGNPSSLGFPVAVTGLSMYTNELRCQGPQRVGIRANIRQGLGCLYQGERECWLAAVLSRPRVPQTKGREKVFQTHTDADSAWTVKQRVRKGRSLLSATAQGGCHNAAWAGDQVGQGALQRPSVIGDSPLIGGRMWPGIKMLYDSDQPRKGPGEAVMNLFTETLASMAPPDLPWLQGFWVGLWHLLQGAPGGLRVKSRWSIGCKFNVSTWGL